MKLELEKEVLSPSYSLKGGELPTSSKLLLWETPARSDVKTL